MDPRFADHVNAALDKLRADGLYKAERVLTGPQQARVATATADRPVLNFCANNYLGLANHPKVIAAARAALDTHGYGMASVRFICGTQDLHKRLEREIADFLGFDDSILYASCFDANGGLFETLLGPEDAVISDALNHASIIDGIRLCKAKRYRYNNNDLADLEAKLKEAEAAGARFKLISTDGVFSMDGSIARLDAICDLADKHRAIVHYDDCHAAGFLGAGGRGTHEFRGCVGRVDLTTGTLGKAIGGALGGYTAGRRELVELLRQRSRPYLFSNSLPPSVVAASTEAVRFVRTDEEGLRARLWRNAALWRELLTSAGFDLLPGEHPITPVMFYDAKRAAAFAEALLARGVYVIAFSFPVVPEGKARIRTQVSAAHTEEDLRFAAEQFAAVRAKV